MRMLSCIRLDKIPLLNEPVKCPAARPESQLVSFAGVHDFVCESFATAYSYLCRSTKGISSRESLKGAAGRSPTRPQR